jgi:hypothetical protein
MQLEDMRHQLIICVTRERTSPDIANKDALPRSGPPHPIHEKHRIWIMVTIEMTTEIQ